MEHENEANPEEPKQEEPQPVEAPKEKKSWFKKKEKTPKPEKPKKQIFKRKPKEPGMGRIARWKRTLEVARKPGTVSAGVE